MSLFSSWRTSLRIARREARRSKGRSALVVAMIALPIVALSSAAVLYDQLDLTPDEQATHTMGAADGRIQWEYRQAVEQDVQGNYGWPAGQGDTTKEPGKNTVAELLTKLPAGSRAVPVRSGTVQLKTADGVSQPNLISVDAQDPLTAGYVKVLGGRAPRTITEVALTKQAAAKFAVDIGGTVKSGDGLRSYTVVGLVEFPSLLQQVVLVPPVTEESPTGLDLQPPSWLVDTPNPLTWAAVRELNTSGLVVASRYVFANPPPASEMPWQSGPAIRVEDLAIGVLVAGLALLEIVLMAGPAFAVSARRRQRQLALVAANGGTAAQVRRIVLADGIVLGCVGAVVGIAVGVLAATAVRPYVEELLTHSRGGAFRVFPLALVAISALAIVTGLLAALVPAFITARQNVISSLAGRRGVTRSKKRWILLGVVMVAIGTAVVALGTLDGSAQILLGGLVIGELGLVFCTPALVGLIARIGRILPLAPRIALRDAARNRASAAPAISAVMAAVAGSVAIGLYYDSTRSQQLENQTQSLPTGYVTAWTYEKMSPTDREPPSLTSIENVLRSTLPVADVRTVSAPACLPEENATSTSTGASTPTSGTVVETGGTAQATKVNDRFCLFQAVLPKDQECPYLSRVRGDPRPLTAAEQKTAKADPRCDEASMNFNMSTTVDDGSALAILTGAPQAQLDAARTVLRSGGVVVSDARFVFDGKVTIAVADIKGPINRDPMETAQRISFPAYVITNGVTTSRAIVSTETLAKAHLGSAVSGLVASTTRMPSDAEEERFTDQLNGLRTSGNIERGPRVEIPIEIWLIMAAAALITLSAAGIGTGLAAADGRADLSTLASVGASPRLRRGLSLSQSGVISGLGSLLGATAGLGAGVAILIAQNQRYVNVWPAPTPYPISIPWTALAAALLIVPAVAILGAGVLTRSRLPIERRT